MFCLQVFIWCAKEFNDAKKIWTARRALFLLLRNTRCETDPIEPGHVNMDIPIFTFRFSQPEGLLLPARNDPEPGSAQRVFFASR